MQTPSHSAQGSIAFEPSDGLQTPSKHRARDIFIACLFVEAWLIFLHFKLALHETPTVRALGQAFDMTRESSIATYWACLLALATGLGCFYIAKTLRETEARKARYRGWAFAGVVFVCVSVDDAIAFHEKIGAITSLGLMRSLNYPSYPWHISVAPIVVVGVLIATFFIWRDVRNIKGKTATLLLALGFFGLALALDIMEGVEEMTAMAAGTLAARSETLPILMVSEEVLEMAGTTLLLYVVLHYAISLVRGDKPAPATDRSAGQSEDQA